MKTPHKILLGLMVLSLGAASAQDLSGQGAAEGLANFIEFSKVIPSMDELLKSVFSVMAAMDVAGAVDTVARLIAGVIAVLTFGIAWANYGFGKRLSFAGIDGSFTNMMLAGFTVLFISTGVPRIVGEAGWAVWRVAYTSVENRVHPSMDALIRDRTGTLANVVWNYGAAGLASGFQPYMVMNRYYGGQLDLNKSGAAGQPFADANKQRIEDIRNNNKRYGAIWQLGSLLIASMYMAYVGVILGSGLFVVFMATFMPIAFAFIPMNSGLIVRSLGGITSSIFVAAVAPGLMMANVAIIFDGPIRYLTDMMKNTTDTAVTNANMLQAQMKSCINAVSTDSGNVVKDALGGVQNAIDNANPMDKVSENICVIGSAWAQQQYTLGQSAMYMIIGLVVAAMLFIGLSGLAMMIFREFKSVVDTVLASGGGLGNGGTGKGQAFASGAMNRLTGAAMVAAGAASGNAALTKAGANSVVSGRNALGGMVSAADETRRDRDSTRQDAARREQQLVDRDENRQYSEDLYNRREAAKEQKQTANDAARQEERRGRQDKGEGSRTDPRSATSGGDAATQPNGGAQNSDPSGRSASGHQGAGTTSGEGSRDARNAEQSGDDDETPPPSGGGPSGGGNGGGPSGGSGAGAGMAAGASAGASAGALGTQASTASSQGAQGPQNASGADVGARGSADVAQASNADLNARYGGQPLQGGEMQARGQGDALADERIPDDVYEQEAAYEEAGNPSREPADAQVGAEAPEADRNGPLAPDSGREDNGAAPALATGTAMADASNEDLNSRYGGAGQAEGRDNAPTDASASQEESAGGEAQRPEPQGAEQVTSNTESSDSAAADGRWQGSSTTSDAPPAPPVAPTTGGSPFGRQNSGAQEGATTTTAPTATGSAPVEGDTLRSASNDDLNAHYGRPGTSATSATQEQGRQQVTEVDDNGPLAPGGTRPVAMGEVDVNGPLPGGARPVVQREYDSPQGRATVSEVGEYDAKGQPQWADESNDDLNNRYAPGSQEEDAGKGNGGASAAPDVSAPTVTASAGRSQSQAGASATTTSPMSNPIAVPADKAPTEVDINGPLAPGGTRPIVVGEVDTNGPLPGGAQPIVVREYDTLQGGQQQAQVARYRADGSVDAGVTTAPLSTPPAQSQQMGNDDLNAPSGQVNKADDATGPVPPSNTHS